VTIDFEFTREFRQNANQRQKQAYCGICFNGL